MSSFVKTASVLCLSLASVVSAAKASIDPASLYDQTTKPSEYIRVAPLDAPKVAPKTKAVIGSQMKPQTWYLFTTDDRAIGSGFCRGDASEGVQVIMDKDRPVLDTIIGYYDVSADDRETFSWVNNHKVNYLVGNNPNFPITDDRASRAKPLCKALQFDYPHAQVNKGELIHADRITTRFQAFSKLSDVTEALIDRLQLNSDDTDLLRTTLQRLPLPHVPVPTPRPQASPAP